MLVAHMDTVPPVDAEAWSTDPYSLTSHGERLIGLGATDMKGAIVAMLHAAARLVGDRPRQGSLTLAFTADEEEGSEYGVLWLCEEGLIDADAVILTEPASMTDESWDALYVGHRGSFVARLLAHGTPGHSGENVPFTERASWPFAQALVALSQDTSFEGYEHDLDGTKPLLNVATTVVGGATPWAHPAILEATLEVRTIPGMTQEGVLKTLRSVLTEAGLADSVTLEPLSDHSWCPPADEVRDTRLLEASRFAWSSVLGREPRSAFLQASTDASRIASLGIPTLPTFGPGTLRRAHQPGEWLSRNDLARAVDLFEVLIRRYLDVDVEHAEA
jgi:acetylornithine deacetylase/succinyl-diaminopimelate desuccinylase-like protein